jgi:hypothetical protein
MRKHYQFLQQYYKKNPSFLHVALVTKQVLHVRRSGQHATNHTTRIIAEGFFSLEMHLRAIVVTAFSNSTILLFTGLQAVR